jgi:hypothetical protein
MAIDRVDFALMGYTTDYRNMALLGMLPVLHVVTGLIRGDTSTLFYKIQTVLNASAFSEADLKLGKQKRRPPRELPKR